MSMAILPTYIFNRIMWSTHLHTNTKKSFGLHWPYSEEHYCFQMRICRAATGIWAGNGLNEIRLAYPLGGGRVPQRRLSQRRLIMTVEWRLLDSKILRWVL